MEILLIAIIIYLAIHHLVDVWYFKARLNSNELIMKNILELYRILNEEVQEMKQEEEYPELINEDDNA